MDRSDGHTHDPAQYSQQLQQRARPAACDVEHPAGDHLSWCVGRCQVGLDNVIHEGEVPALLAVTVDHWWLAPCECPYEEGDDRGVGRVRALPGPEDVEVAEGHGLEAIELCEDTAVVLAGQL